MTSNAIARTDDTRTGLEVLPPARPAMSMARQVLMEHADLASMAYEFATKLVGTKMVPVRFRNQPEEATAAILYGAEIGLGPISALQNIFDVHGSPGIYARTAQALLEAKGFKFETLLDTAAACEVAGWMPGTTSHETSKFTIEDAERAGWCPTINEATGKYKTNQNGKLAGNEKYLTQPRQMLWAKAMMEVCRRLSPATLLGIAYSVEELESEQPAETPALAGRPAATDALTVDEILAGAPDKADDAPAKALAKGKPKGHTSRVEAALAKAQATVAATAEGTTAEATPPPAQEAPAAPEPEAVTVVDQNGTKRSFVPGDEPASWEEVTAAAAADAQEPTPDPSEPEPTGDEQPPPLDMGDDPDGDLDEQADIAAAQEPEPERDDRPATKEQLQELTQLIGAAGFQPTDEGRTEWFAFVSQTVGRDITANNKLTRDEIVRVSKELRDSQP